MSKKKDQDLNAEDQALWQSFCEEISDGLTSSPEVEDFESLLEGYEARRPQPSKPGKPSPQRVLKRQTDQLQSPSSADKRQERRLPPKGLADVDRRTRQKLRRGQFAVQAILDLHGHDRYAAFDRLTAFVQTHYHRGTRVVLVITGKGLLSPDGTGILKKSLPRWIEDQPLSNYILDYTLARGKDGGGGAYYLLIRRKS